MDAEDAIRRIGTGSLVIMLGFATGSVLEYVVKIIIARWLGPGEYGVFVQGLAVVQVAAVVAIVGLHRAMPRFISYERGREKMGAVGAAVRTGTAVVAVGGVVTAAALYLAAPVLATAVFQEPGLVRVLRVLAVGVLPLSAFYFAVSLLRGHQDARHKVLVADVLLPAVEAGLLVVFLGYGLGLDGILAAYILAVTVAAVATILAVRRVVGGPVLAGDGFIPRRLLLFSWPLMAVSIIVVVDKWIDVLMLGWLMDAPAVGVYEVAMAVAGTLVVFLSGLNYMFMPVLSELLGSGRGGAAGGVYRTATRWVVTASLPLLVGFLVFPGQVLALLFGEGYVGGRVVLSILAVGYFYWCAVGPAGMTLVAAGKPAGFLAGMAVLGVVDVAGNLLLIPRFGTVGAAVAMTAGMVAGNTVLLVLARREVDAPLPGMDILGPVGAMAPLALVAAVVAGIVHPGPLLALGMGAVLTVAYVGLCVVTGAIPREEVDAAWGAVRRAAGHGAANSR